MPYYHHKKSIKKSVPSSINRRSIIHHNSSEVDDYGQDHDHHSPIGRYEVDFINKTFDEIKAECLRKKILFKDPAFPASDESLFFSQLPKMNFEWKRPIEISSNPQLFVGGASPFNILQGELGDCWLLAAIASLSLNEDLLYRIIPPEQSFGKTYCGIFHFHFWQYGEWIDVVVDDLLPTCNGRLVYLHSKDPDEFWSPLLEKAYAKLHGSFEALKGGSTTEVMEDFTGGVSEIYELSEPPKNLYNLIEKSLKKGAVVGCTIEIQTIAQREAKLPNGLLMGHAYSVTAVETIQTGENLVRVRNPWGQVEWNGPWSDSSPRWRAIPDVKKRLDIEFNEGGEFWMSFREFCKCFSRLEICNLGPDVLEDDNVSTQWITSIHEGRWIRGCSAGGCRNFPETFWINPQFRLILEEEDDEPYNDEVGCSFIVSLMQKHRRKQKSKGQSLLTIGFAIYQLKNSIPKNYILKKNFFLHNQSVARSKQFINLRENSERLRLPPGEYVIIPSTFQPNEEADFVLRLFTEKRSLVNDVDVKTNRIPTLSWEPEENEESEENDRKFKMLFDQLTGVDGEIDAFELQDILNTVVKKYVSNAQNFTGFDLEACRSMVAYTDVTESGKLNYDEFKVVWIRVRQCINIFKMFDKDNNGTFDSFELREALSQAGFSLRNRLYQKLCVRYASKDLTISLSDFVLLSVKLEEMFIEFDIFVDKFKAGSTEIAKVTLDKWLDSTMYS